MPNTYPDQVFDQTALRRICEMREHKFINAFGLEVLHRTGRDDFLAFQDNGASVLAVAHLDTVSDPGARAARFTKTEDGLVVHSRALDDRLGAYVILDMLPQLGIHTDILLTTGEETGNSTAQFFDPENHRYDWIIEFDRGGTDVVMYQYDDAATRSLVRASGAVVGNGSFSDIAYLDHLGVKAFNWGVGYRDYHGPRSHAYLNDTFEMVEAFQAFYAQNEGTRLPHFPERQPSATFSSSLYDWDEGRPAVLGDVDDWLIEDDVRSGGSRRSRTRRGGDKYVTARYGTWSGYRDYPGMEDDLSDSASVEHAAFLAEHGYWERSGDDLYAEEVYTIPDSRITPEMLTKLGY